MRREWAGRSLWGFACGLLRGTAPSRPNLPAPAWSQLLSQFPARSRLWRLLRSVTNRPAVPLIRSARCHPCVHASHAWPRPSAVFRVSLTVIIRTPLRPTLSVAGAQRAQAAPIVRNSSQINPSRMEIMRGHASAGRQSGAAQGRTGLQRGEGAGQGSREGEGGRTGCAPPETMAPVGADGGVKGGTRWQLLIDPPREPAAV